MRCVSESIRDKIDYVVACVNEFSDVHGMDYVSGFDYLRRYSGVEFLDRHYAVEHAYSIEDAVADIAAVCRRNGGDL